MNLKKGKGRTILSVSKLLLTLLSIFSGAQSICAAVDRVEQRIYVRQYTYAWQGDSVEIEMEISWDQHRIASQSYVVLTPELRSDNHSKELPFVQLNGNKHHKAYKRLLALKKVDDSQGVVIRASDQSNYLYKITLPYEPWMEKARFMLYEEQCECAGPLIPVSKDLLAEKITNLNPPVGPPSWKVAFVTPEVEGVKQRRELGKVFLDYPVNVSEIKPEFRKNATELERIYQLISSIKNNPDTTINVIDITGFASPEGTFYSNLMLSERRALAMAAHLKKFYGLSDNLFNANGHGEDWDTLDSLVASSEMKDKEQILAIIRGTDVPDNRDKKLMALSGGASYRFMRDNFFPQLRRTNCEVKYTVSPITVERGKEVLKTRPSSLSLNEMFLIANSYESGSEASNDVYETAARIYPQNDVANLNAAASALNRKDVSSALHYLSKVNKPSPAWHNNRGVLYGLQGEWENATAAFMKAKILGNAEAVLNLEEIKKQK